MPESSSINRREVLGIGAAAGVAAFLPHAATAQERAGARRCKNIIFMVSDGMSLGALSMAEPFSHRVRGRGTHWYRMMQDSAHAHGFFETHSLNSLVTDSAAAASAWGSGSRVFNGSLNVLPDGTPLEPIAVILKQSGRRVGLVTTTQLTHATPAGFAVQQASRNDHADIAPQYLDRVDVLMGGGVEYFDPALREDGRDLFAAYRDAGYAVWNSREQLSGAAPDKVLGLFWEGHVPYTVDWRQSEAMQAKVPTLAEMTRVALQSLSRGDQGFLLQAEGGRVDHAAHANDAAGLLWDQLAFDDAIEVALEYVSKDPDTLLVITTDHGNSNPGLNGQGSAYRDTDDAFELLTHAKASYEVLGGEFKKLAAEDKLSSDVVRDRIKDALQITLTEREANAIFGVLSGDPPYELYRAHANAAGIMGQAIGNHTGVGWTSVSHTQDLAPITAIGPGRERFSGLLKNTDAFGRMLELFGLRHQNPSMTAEQARQYRSAWAPASPLHWV